MKIIEFRKTKERIESDNISSYFFLGKEILNSLLFLFSKLSLPFPNLSIPFIISHFVNTAILFACLLDIIFQCNFVLMLRGSAKSSRRWQINDHATETSW